MEQIKIDKDKRYKYDEMVAITAKDDGLVMNPGKEDIEKDRKMFKEFYERFPEFDAAIVKVDDINTILVQSVYPGKNHEWLKLGRQLKARSEREPIGSLYNDVLKDAVGILDFDRMILSILNFTLTGESNPIFDRLLTTKRIKEFAINYLDGLKKDNFVIFSSFIKPDSTIDHKVINYNNLKNNYLNREKKLSLSNRAMEYASEMLYTYDGIAFCDYYLAGLDIENNMRVALHDVKDDTDEGLEKGYEIGAKVFMEYFNSKEFAPYMDVEKIAALTLVRTAEALDYCKLIENEQEYKELEIITSEFINICKTTKNQDKKIRYLCLPQDESKEAEINICTIDEALRIYGEKYSDMLVRLSAENKNIPYYMLRNPLKDLDTEGVIALSKLVDNPEDFIFLAYTKKDLPDEVLKALFVNNKRFDIDKILPKLALTKSRDVSKLIDGELINLKDIETLYYRNIIGTKDVARLTKGKLNSDPRKLALLYKALYADNIIKIFKNKEKYSDEDIIALLDQNPTLARGVKDKERRAIMKKQLRLHADLAKINNCFDNEEFKNEFLEALGDELQISSKVIIDMYKKGVITKEVGESLDKDFAKYVHAKETKKYDRSKEKQDILAREDRVMNLYEHGRLKPADIIKLYALGMISRKIYDKLADDTFKGQVSKKVLCDMIEGIKQAGAKEEAFDAIEKYVNEARRWSADNNFFKEYDEKILVSKKIDKQKLITLGKKGLLSREALAKILDRGDISVIVKLLEGENHLSLDTARYLFQDVAIEGEKITHKKRDLLEKVFRSGHFTNDEMFSILLATYRGSDEKDELQVGLNNDNLQYFFDNGFIKIDFDDGKVDKKYKDKEKQAVHEGEDYTGCAYDKDNQRRYPLFERFDSLFTIDPYTVFNKKGPALVFNLKTLNKTIIETLGTIKDDVLVQDLTNHGTFIVDSDVYEENKKEFTTESESNHKEIIQYNRLLEWFNEYKYDTGFGYFKHTKNWAANVRKALGIKEDKNKKNNNTTITTAQMKEIMDR